MPNVKGESEFMEIKGKDDCKEPPPPINVFVVLVHFTIMLNIFPQEG